MKALRVIIVVLAVVVACLNVGLHFANATKNEGPIITCDTDTIKVSCHAKNEEILKHLKATDKQDGDLTDKIIIEKKSYFTTKSNSRIVFAVIDSDKNIATIDRNISYTDYESPKINMMTDLILPTQGTYSLSNYFTATDVIDGDISNRIKIISSEFNAAVAGKYKVNVKVTNSMGDYSDVSIDAIVTDRKFSTSIKLSDYIVYVNCGDDKEIDYRSYISEVDSESKQVTASNVVVDYSEVNLKKAGVYNVYYTVGNAASPEGMTRLVVVVEDSAK